MAPGRGQSKETWTQEKGGRAGSREERKNILVYCSWQSHKSAQPYPPAIEIKFIKKTST